MPTYRHTSQVLEVMDKAQKFEQEKVKEYENYIGYLLYQHRPMHPIEVLVQNSAKRIIEAGIEPNILVSEIAKSLNNKRVFERHIKDKTHPKAFLNIEINNTLSYIETNGFLPAEKVYERVSPLVMKTTKSGRKVGSMSEYFQQTVLPKPEPPKQKTEEELYQEQLDYFLGGNP